MIRITLGHLFPEFWRLLRLSKAISTTHFRPATLFVSYLDPVRAVDRLRSSQMSNINWYKCGVDGCEYKAG